MPFHQIVFRPSTALDAKQNRFLAKNQHTRRKLLYSVMFLSCQKLGMISENKMFQKLKLSRNVNSKSLANLYPSLGNLSTHITIFTVIVTISGGIMRNGCRIIIRDYHAPFGVIQWCAYQFAAAMQHPIFFKTLKYRNKQCLILKP